MLCTRFIRIYIHKIKYETGWPATSFGYLNQTDEDQLIETLKKLFMAI